jgi:uncharacterized protein (TIGR00730 family)
MTTPSSELLTITRLCVYCASSTGSNPQLASATSAFGTLLARENIELVYGGGAVGLMGLIADTVMTAGGTVTGIIPSGLFPVEVGHNGVTELIEVGSMHERKAEMIRRSDAFVALPGGFGTLEELAEVLTWAQIGLHRKPVGVLNVDGFFDGLLEFFDRCVNDTVLKEKNRNLLIVAEDPAELLQKLRHHRPVYEKKWHDLEQI